MKKILVTGGAGFIGSHLVDKLISDGNDVIVLDSFDPQVHQGKTPDYLNKNARYIKGDVADEKAVKKSINGAEVVFHLAAKVGVGQSMYEIKNYVAANAYGTAVLWDYIINNKCPIKKFIVASSMSIYGEGAYRCAKCGMVAPYLRKESDLKEKRWDVFCPGCGGILSAVATPEDKRLLPTSVYAVTKKDQEEISLNIGISYKIPTVALRFFNVYGPRQALSNPYTGACAIFSSRIKNGNAPLIYEDGMQTRDFISVKDIVQACVLAMDNPECDYGYFNVGTGRPVTIKKVAEILISLYRKDVKPEVVNRYRIGDIRHCYADMTKIKKFGFEPQVTLEDGLRDLVKWGEAAEAVDRVDEANRELERRNLKI